MWKYLIVLVVLCGIHVSNSSRQSSQQPSQVGRNGIKKNEVGANGRNPPNSYDIGNNFRNPVLEYLYLKRNSPGSMGMGPDKGTVREIRHSQTLLIPDFRSAVSSLFEPNFIDFDNANEKPLNLPPEKRIIKSWENSTDAFPSPSPAAVTSPPNSINLNSKSDGNGRRTEKTHENIVKSQVIRVNANADVRERNKGRWSGRQHGEEFIQVQTYPATALLINSYSSDGTLKSSLTHFQPDFFGTLLQDYLYDRREGGKKTNYHSNLMNAGKSVGNFLGESLSSDKTNLAEHKRESANFLNLPRPSLYSAVSSIVEYEKGSETSDETIKCLKTNEVKSSIREKSVFVDSEKKRCEDSSGRDPKEIDQRMLGENSPDDVIYRSDTPRKGISPVMMQRNRAKNQSRSVRDTTSVLLKNRLGDRINITVEEPQDVNRKLVKIGDSDVVLRKGGIAIAGPGGAAVAYTGGTAIVGPYGTVYKSPEGTAIIGPYGKIVNITDDMNFEEIIKMHKDREEGRSPLTVARGQTQTHKFRNFQNFFAYKTNRPLQIELIQQKPSLARLPNVLRLKDGDLKKKIEATLNQEFRRVVQDTPVEEKVVRANQTSLIFHPKSKAEAGRNGVAVSAPVSHAILFPGQRASIFFEPESVASAGPSGFAHAHSDLFVSYVDNGTSLKP